MINSRSPSLPLSSRRWTRPRAWKAASASNSRTNAANRYNILSTGPTGQRAWAPTHPALRPAPCSPVHALRGTLLHALRGSLPTAHMGCDPAPSHKRSRDLPTRIRPARLIAPRHLCPPARPRAVRPSSSSALCGPVTCSGGPSAPPSIFTPPAASWRRRVSITTPAKVLSRWLGQSAAMTSVHALAPACGWTLCVRVQPGAPSLLRPIRGATHRGRRRVHRARLGPFFPLSVWPLPPGDTIRLPSPAFPLPAMLNHLAAKARTDGIRAIVVTPLAVSARTGISSSAPLWLPTQTATSACDAKQRPLALTLPASWQSSLWTFRPTALGATRTLPPPHAAWRASTGAPVPLAPQRIRPSEPAHTPSWQPWLSISAEHRFPPPPSFVLHYTVCLRHTARGSIRTSNGWLSTGPSTLGTAGPPPAPGPLGKLLL
jgi:hypothetical protein